MSIQQSVMFPHTSQGDLPLRTITIGRLQTIIGPVICLEEGASAARIMAVVRSLVVFRKGYDASTLCV